MKRRIVKCLSMFALAAVVGVSAFSAEVNAGGDRCYSCDTYSMELNHGVSVTFMNADEHLVSVTHVYTCKNCGKVDDQSYSYTEGHDYELNEIDGKMICIGCKDSYYW